MMMRRLLGTVVACAFLLPGTATAAGDFDRFGFYLGLNGAYGFPLFEDQVQDALGPTAELNDTWGLNTRAGVRLLSFLAIEAQYEWMKDFQIDAPNPLPDVDITGHTLTGNLKFIIPVWRVHPYLLAGFGFTSYKFDAVGAGSFSDMFFAGRLGGGADIYITEHWAINAEATALLTANELDGIASNLDNLNSLHYVSASVGLMYRF